MRKIRRYVWGMGHVGPGKAVVGTFFGAPCTVGSRWRMKARERPLISDVFILSFISLLLWVNLF